MTYLMSVIFFFRIFGVSQDNLVFFIQDWQLTVVTRIGNRTRHFCGLTKLVLWI